MNERFAGRFQLLRRLGTGGMGEVFLARDLTTGFECALKRLRVDDAELSHAAQHEFEALTRVRHPAVVAVYELGVTAEGVPFYTMEYVPGLPSDRALAPDDRPSFFYVAARVALGLEVLHAANVVHGDLKPSNLMVLPGDRPGALPRSVRLVDFGLAALIGRAGQGHVGTPGYAAPEVVGGQTPSPTSDLYGLGATLYTILARRPPFAGEDAAAVLRRQQAGSPSTSPLEVSGVPAPMIQLILRLMAASPTERPRNAREVRRALEAMHPAARRPLEERIETASLAGRERELARFETWWTRATTRPQLMILTGVAGAGKSALLSELATRATLAGRAVIHLSCGAFEGPRAVAAALARRIAAEAGADASVDLALNETDDGGRDREQDLDAWAAAVTRWVAPAARSAGGLVVLIDDAERLDEWSRSWMRRLLSQSDPAPISWLWARRRSDRAPEDESMLLATRLAERIELEPLEREGLAQLAAVRIGDTLPPALEQFLWSSCGGHPGLAVDLLRRAAAAGAIVEDDMALRVDETRLAAIGAPADYEASLVERCAALEPAARGLAEALAVWGGPLAAAHVARLSPGAEGDTIEKVLESGLASRLPSGEIQLWPPLLADRLSIELTAERRREIHRAALGLPDLTRLQRFEHLRGAGDARAALDEARLAMDQGDASGLAHRAAELAEREVPDAAAEWHERAAKQFMDRRLFAPAAHHLRRALELEPTGPQRVDRWVLLCRAAQRSGQPDEVFRIVEAASGEDLPVWARARMMADESMARLAAGQRSAGRERALEAIALAETSGEAEAEGVAAQALGYLSLDANQIEESESWTRRATAAFERAGRPDYARAVTLRASLARAKGKLEEAERLQLEAIESARRAGDRHAIEDLLIHLATIQAHAGRWDEAVRSFGTIARIGVEDARTTNVPQAKSMLAIMEGLTGRPRPAHRHAREAIQLAKLYRPRLEPVAWRALAQAERVLGRTPRAHRAVQRALSIAARGGKNEQDLELLELAKIEFASGQWGRAASVARTTLDSSGQEPTIEAAFLSIVAGRAALRLGQPEQAEAHAKTIERWLERNHWPYVQAQLFQLQAEIAFIRQKADDGFRLGQESLDAYAALPAPPDRAAAALDLAQFAPAGERGAEVVRWLEIAATTFERIGDRRGRERALARLVERLKTTEVAPAPAGGDRGLLERVSWLLNSLADVRELTQRAMRMVVEQLGAERGVLLLFDRETGQLNVMAEHGAVDAKVRGQAMRFSRRVVQRVTESGGAVLIEDAPSDPRGVSDSVRDLQLRSIVCVPLFLGGAVIGAVYLDSREAHHFGEEERGLLEGFAHLMAIAIETARGHEEIERMKTRLEGENLSLRQEVGSRFQYQNLIGSSSEMRRVLALIEPAGQARSTVLITGENGTGKELVARILHHSGQRRKGPFVSVNCGAIPQTLVESELFGILSNVATQVRAREGRFQQADGGTLFLDEIGEMPPAQQVALLAAIANREVTPVGGSRPIPVDVRIVAATNRNLRRLVEEQRFREDLYYRLAVIEIEIPPLRERKADIPALARHFIQHFASSQKREVPKLSPDFMAVLMQSDWPGNVRELQNYIERVVAMNPGPVVRPDPLPRDLQERSVAPRHARGRGLVATVGEVERRMVSEALQRAGGNQSQAARYLGLTEQSLRYRLRKYGLAPRENRRIR